MDGLNRFQFICRVAEKPELRYGGTGTAFLELAVKINKFVSGGGQKEVIVKVKFFGENAEDIKEFVVPGSRVYCEGEITVESWSDKQTNQPRSKMVLSGNSVIFLDPRGEATHEPMPPLNTKPAASAPARTPWSKPPPAPTQGELTPPPKKEDDVPF